MQAQSAGGRPWASVLGLSLDQLVAWGVLFYAYSVLALPMARDLGVSSQLVAAAFSCALLISSLLARPVGRLLDREGARPVLFYGALVGPVAFVALATVPHQVTLLLVFAGLGLAQALSLYEPAFRAIVDWFPESRLRSRALLVLTCIAGLASTVFLPLTAWLLDRFGWRLTALALAAVLAAVTLPVRLALPQPTRAHGHGESPRPGPGGVPVVVRMLGVGLALQALAATGASIVLVWQFVERGESLTTAAAIAGLAGASQVPGRLLLSPASSLLPTDIRLPLLLVVQAVSLVGMAGLSGPALLVAVVVFGAAAGVMTLERAAVVLEWFGQENFGVRSGQLASGALLARAGAPFAVEQLHVALSYADVLKVLAVCLLVGSAILALATRARFRPPVSSASSPGSP